MGPKDGLKKLFGWLRGMTIQEMCKPCALALAAEGERVKTLPGRSEKITCARCGRRRFGVSYEVGGRVVAGTDVKQEGTK